jgi:regulator of Ty1 transposition protein 103
MLTQLELDKTRSSGKRLGGSIFSSNTGSTPNELAPLVEPQQALTKSTLSAKTALSTANQDYDKLNDPSATTPTAPVHAARLNGLLKSLANAEGAVAESIKARKALIEGLEKILGTNRAGLAADETQLSELSSRKNETDTKKRDVEDTIMRGFNPNSNPSTPAGAENVSPAVNQSPITPAPEPDRPEVEALTPPGYPQPPATEPVPELELDLHANNGTAHMIHNPQPPAQPSAGSDLLSSLSTSYSGSAASVKKRKLNDSDFPDLGGDAMDGLDADVAEMLWKDSNNGH